MMTTDTTIPFAEEKKRENMFVATVRKLVRDNGRMLLMATGSFLGFSLLLGILLGVLKTGGGTGEVMFYFCVSTLFSRIFASVCFGDMKTKESRIAVLMQPATAMQKFTPRLLAAFIVVPAMVAIGFLILELGRLTGMFIRFQEGISMVNPFTVFGIGYGFIDVFVLVTMWVFTQAIFFFGGILWPRLSFIKTAGVLIAIQFVLVMTWSISLAAIMKNGYVAIPLISMNTFIWIVESTLLALTLVLIIAAYYRFRNSTVMYGVGSKSRIK